jgi:hypothetical protein
MLVPIEYFIDETTEFLPELLPKQRSKYLIVPVWFPLTEHFGNTTYTTELIAESLDHYHKNSLKNQGIVFLSHTEAFSVYYIQKMQEVVKYLIEKYNYPLSKFTYIVGAHPVRSNLLLYFKLCREYKFYPINPILVNFMELYTNDMNFSAKIDFNQVYTVPRKKTKKFISLHGVPRLFRLVLTSQLIKRNLLDNAFYSIWINTTNQEKIEFDIAFDKEFVTKGSKQFPNLIMEVPTILNAYISKFPMMVYPTFTDTTCYCQDDVFLYNNSYFSLVGETVFAKYAGLQDDLFYECYDFSEKLFRPIKFKHPFILLARPNSLKVLREDGYKTFHPFINESYDLIENDEDRLLAILTEVERLCNYTDEEWLEFQKNVRDIVEHNAMYLDSRGIKKLQLSMNRIQPKEIKKQKGIFQKMRNLFGHKKA